MMIFKTPRLLTLFVLSLFALPLTSHAAEKTVQEKNKELVTAFYEMTFNQHKPVEAAKEYIGAEYIQHNPYVPNGVEPFTQYFVQYFKDNPDSQIVIHRALADGDLVALHLHSMKNKTDTGEAVVDLFRVKDGKIVEHWDVIQAVPAEKSASGNTMFDTRSAP